MDLDGVGVVGEVGQIVGVGVGGARVAVDVDVTLLLLLVVLRLGVQLLGHLAQECRRRACARARPPAGSAAPWPSRCRAVGLGQLAQLA